MELTRTDKRILKVLIEGGLEPASTYKIPKKTGISRATVILHCYKLMESGIIEGDEIKSDFGNGKP